jgi:putative ABC transport system permease protein
MRFLNRLRAIIVVVVKRVTSQPWLVIATTLGLVVAIGLMMSIPIYADAVYHRTFLKNIVPDGMPDDRMPPFSFLFRYDGSIYGSQAWEDIAEVDDYLSNEAGAALGLPQQMVVRYATTDPFGIFPADTTTFDNMASPLVWSAIAFISDLSNHVTILEGRFPEPVLPVDGAALEVMIHEELATQMGAQVGETFVAYLRVRGQEGNVQSLQFPLRIAGVWTPTDPFDAFWLFRPSAFTERLMVPEGSFRDYIGALVENEVYTAAWYMVMDGQEITHNDAGTLIRRTLSVEQRAANLLTNTSLGSSPLDALIDYRRSANLLTILLYAFSIPILGLLLAFITLTAGLSIERRRNEVAVLRSRGAMALQMVGIAGIESLLIGIIALAISSPVGMVVAQLMGRTRSFLDFTAEVDQMRVMVTQHTLRFGIVAVVIGVLAQVVPTLGAAEHTIVSYKRERARLLRKPWWQRAWLDVLLLIPAGYGAHLLRNQGTVVTVQENLGASPFENPLLFLVPALGIFAMTLFFLRLMPVIMSGLAWLAARTKSVGFLMAARHLSRTPGFYSTPLILLVLTLSLSAFTASLAYTLDRHLYDSTYYQGGADVRFLDRGEGQDTGFGGFIGGDSSEEENGDAAEEEEGPRWLFLPVTEYLNTPGVDAVTRIARYPAVASTSTGRREGVFMGVERATLTDICYWRTDFASESLGALMNTLAADRSGVLVHEDYMQENFLNIGDTVVLEVVSYGDRTPMRVQVAGTFRYFPTWYPSEGPLFVGDLGYFFEEAGQQYPYDVWMRVSDETDTAHLINEELDLFTYDWRAPKLEMTAQQAAPERQGLFGLLSVGFAAAAILTVIGFLLYALFSFQRRFIEFGVLRAVGLSSKQMASFLGWELALLILTGGGLGTLLGGWVSAFFIPFLQIGADEASQIPPYVVDIAWSAIFRIYMLFALLFVVAFVALTVMLRRMRIFEAVKLGEAA